MAVQYVHPVWEWMDDYNHWAEFDPSCAVELENGFTSGSSVMRLSLSPHVPPSYDVHFISRDGSQENETKNGPEETLTRTHTPPSAPIWSYTTPNGTQHPHTPAVSTLIETNYTEAQNSKSLNRALGLGAFHMIINGEQFFVSFATEGYQVNRGSRRQRGIRRRAGPHVGRSPVGGALATMGYDPNSCFVVVNESDTELDCAVCFEAIRFESEKVVKKVKKEGEEEEEEEEEEDEQEEEEEEDEANPGNTALTPVSFISSLAEADMSVVGASATSSTPTATSSTRTATSSSPNATSDTQCVRLSKCVHTYHRGCIQKWFDKRPACPECLTSYGEYRGTQPLRGASMTASLKKWRAQYGLEGFAEVDVIEIVYLFEHGVQGREHPKPGKPYAGTARIAYLPDNAEGLEVLALLKKAWERRLVFTVGQSVTTGKDDCVIWNGIHHKTSMHGGPTKFGYPDETYFVRVKGELADLGVTAT